MDPSAEPQQQTKALEVTPQGEVVYHRQQPIVLTQQPKLQQQRPPEPVQLMQQLPPKAPAVPAAAPPTLTRQIEHFPLVGELLPGGHTRHDVVVRPVAMEQQPPCQPMLFQQPPSSVAGWEKAQLVSASQMSSRDGDVVQAQDHVKKIEELKEEVERLKEKLSDAEFTISDLETKLQYQEAGRACSPELIELRRMVSQICKYCHRYISDPYDSASHQKRCQAHSRRGAAANPNLRGRTPSPGPRRRSPGPPHRPNQYQYQQQHKYQYPQQNQGRSNGNWGGYGTGGYHRGRSLSAGRTPPRRQRSGGRHGYWNTAW